MLAKNLQVYDKIKSSTGNWLTVKKVEVTANRIIVLFDGDREIDFKPYDSITEVEEFSKKGWVWFFEMIFIYVGIIQTE